MPDYILIIAAFFSVMGFSLLFNTPSKSVFLAGLCGALGWTVYSYGKHAHLSVVIASFLGAMAAGILGEVFAIKYKRPATVFIIPAILPLVPGYGLYNTMFHTIRKQYAVAANFGIESIMIALAIACGLVFSSTSGRVFRSIKKSRLTKKIEKST